MNEGSCRLGLWHVQVSWDKNIIHRIRFAKSQIPGSVPEQITRFLAGKSASFIPLTSPLLLLDGVYGDIYRAVHSIPYGSLCTYGEIARLVQTSPRIVGLAMKRNITPLIIPCHRVVSSQGIGGFTPDIWIKEELLRMEAKNRSRFPQPSEND